MKAMILAAGLGTRLRPLTDERPKALVELGGRTLLEITLARLREAGVTEVIVNVHHFADMVVDYLEARGSFGMRIAISREDTLLDTGGGLRKAADFFLRAPDGGGNGDEPFLLHNVDVLSTIDLHEMLLRHRERGALATLAVQQRKSSRYLLMDSGLCLCGRVAGAGGAPEMVRPGISAELWAFTGIHVLSPRIFGLLQDPRGGSQGQGLTTTGQHPAEPVFPIIPEYIRLAGEGEKVVGYSADGAYWRDLGTVASLQQASEDAARGLINF